MVEVWGRRSLTTSVSQKGVEEKEKLFGQSSLFVDFLWNYRPAATS